ncbi:protein-(glutamine-N5) methyltransferase, release factor-specific [bacterium E08(2017)]|nr:protein-(glutamine-N5) methyltransferase, release factor-specific [bacterium E08(2017)]
MTQNPKTLGDVIKSGSEYLAGKSIENPKLLLEMLAARLLNCKRLELPLKYDEVLSEPHLEAMRRGLKRLADNEPVQYIIGATEFMDHTIKTDKRALIPRPETETLVQTILDTSSLWENSKPAIADIGTGSGCITIALALAKPNGIYLGLDISADAIALAKENAELHNLSDNCAFGLGELSDVVDPESLDAIVANLPYISTSDCERLSPTVKDYEPMSALDGGPNGLSIIDPVIQDASFALKPGGHIFLEIGETQADAVSAMLQETGYTDINVIKDLNNRDRIVTATLE